jgi:Ni/Co efflux regulator RcnB
MKKQLLIAAVAATMTSAAMADISISGSADTNGAVDDRDFTDIVIQRKLVSGENIMQAVKKGNRVQFIRVKSIKPEFNYDDDGEKISQKLGFPTLSLRLPTL